jgi:hypothetical protein
MNLGSTSILTNDLSAIDSADRPSGVDQAERFEQLFERAKRGAPETEIREAAEQLVSATFIVPVLSQIRESSNAAPPFAPTQGEKQFGALLDQRVADEIVKSSRLPIVDRLTRDFASRAGIKLDQPAGQHLEVSA